MKVKRGRAENLKQRGNKGDFSMQALLEVSINESSQSNTSLLEVSCNCVLYICSVFRSKSESESALLAKFVYAKQGV